MNGGQNKNPGEVVSENHKMPACWYWTCKYKKIKTKFNMYLLVETIEKRQ